jgi:DNA repair protein RadC
MEAIQATFFDLTPEKIPFKQWQIREGNRLYSKGANQLSDTELLAHIVRDQDIAESLMRAFGSLDAIGDASIDELKQIDGIGDALAEVIITALEFGRRALKPHKFDAINSPESICALLQDEMGMLLQEELRVLILDNQNHVKKIETLFIGTLDSSIVHPREVFKSAIRASAKHIILVHNHPSGKAAPSSDDIRVTRQLVEAGKLIEINVLDHIIITQDEHYSFKEYGQL